MQVSDNLYSKFVALSKVLLPLIALGLLSTLFMFARSSGPTSDIPYADIEQIAREPRISDAAYAGVTDDGSTISVHAATMRPSPEQADTFVIDGLEAVIQGVNGIQTTILAQSGQIDVRAQTARIDGLARISSSDGYQMESSGLIAELTTGTLRSLGPLEVHTPFGQLSAGALLVENPPDGEGPRMDFTNGVSLIYTPDP